MHDFFLYYSSTCTIFFFFFSSRRRHTRSTRDWSSDVCSSDLAEPVAPQRQLAARLRVVQIGEIVEIGRASCRGKSVDLGGRRIIKKKKERREKGTSKCVQQKVAKNIHKQ